MDIVRLDIVKDALIVGDDDEGAFAVAQRVHALGDDFQSIDVQPGIRFIENAQLRLKHRHLQNVVALFLATGETHVHRTGQQIFRHLQQLNFLFHQVLEIEAIQRLLAAIAPYGIQRSLQEELVADAGDLHRILEGHKDAFPGAIFRGELQQVFALKFDAVAGDLVIFAPGQSGRKRTFPRAVWPHYGVDLPRTHLKVQPAQDRFIFDGDM